MCVIEKGVLVILEWEHFSSVCDVMILMTEPAVSAGVSPCSDATLNGCIGPNFAWRVVSP